MYRPIVLSTASPQQATQTVVPLAPAIGAAPRERVTIPRFGRSICAGVLISLLAVIGAQAQDTAVERPATHTVKRGETLWDLAKTYLGDAYLWPAIYRLNTDQIEDPHWIYPGEVLRLGERAAPEVAEQSVQEVRRPSTVTAFSPVGVAQVATKQQVIVARPRVAIGDVLKASYFGPEDGPRGAGKILFSADIPGIDMPRSKTNFQLYDKVLMSPPVGSVAAERERFIAYSLGETIEKVGTMIVPAALLEVVRSPRNGEAATVQVIELYGMLNADALVIPLDTLGAGATGTPMQYRDARTTKVRAVYRPVVLPAMDYEVLFDLSSKDGMKIGDEVELFRPRENAVEGERPALPEVSIATGQVVRVTPFGSTARITSQGQPAIRVGESVRVTARMP